MNLWRLEWLRLVRTGRLVAILGVYAFFGITGPLTARYLGQILGSLDTGVRVDLPDPVPADGVDQFAGDATQIGLLVVVLVAASALAFDARTEMAVFLRTRVTGVRAIVVPAFAVNATAAAAGFVVGAVAAWYETWVLLGPLPPVRMAAGIGYGVLFLAFCVASVAFVAALVRGVLATAGVSLVALLGLAVVGGLTGLGDWLPSDLAGALPALVRGSAVVDFAPSAGITAVLTGTLVWAAVALGERREL